MINFHASLMIIKFILFLQRINDPERTYADEIYQVHCVMLHAVRCLSVFLNALRISRGGGKSRQIIFNFLKGDDMFYSALRGNNSLLDSLSLEAALAASGEGSIRVDGYGDDLEIVKIRCSRVKSELIVRYGLKEESFVTSLMTGAFNGVHDAVVITLPTPVTCSRETQPEESANKLPPETAHLSDNPVTEPERPKEKRADGFFSRWQAGLNAGIPFFWGDMLSMSAGKTYIGFAAGLQCSYRFSELLSVTLSADYTAGRLGARDYAENYMLSPDGMTWYIPGTQPLMPYKDLYSNIQSVNIGLGLDINVNRIFWKDISGHRFTAWISPAVYGQYFHTDIHSKTDDSRYSDGTTQPAGFSLGLGGSMSLRYRIAGDLDIQLKNTAIWMTDNNFDGIRTIFGKTRHNAAWTPQIGIIWNIGNAERK